MKKLKKTRSNTEATSIMNSMTDFEMARWFALIDSVNIIDNMCREKNIAFNSIDIKPSAVEKYIESTCDIYTQKIQDEKLKTTSNVMSKIITHFNVSCQKV